MYKCYSSSEDNCYSDNGSYVCDCQLDYQLSNELIIKCSDINEYNTDWL